MKIDLLIGWLTLIAFVCVGVYAIIWQSLSIDFSIFMGILSTVVACALVWFGKHEIYLRRYERFHNLRKMGLRETAHLIRQGWK